MKILVGLALISLAIAHVILILRTERPRRVDSSPPDAPGPRTDKFGEFEDLP